MARSIPISGHEKEFTREVLTKLGVVIDSFFKQLNIVLTKAAEYKTQRDVIEKQYEDKLRVKESFDAWIETTGKLYDEKEFKAEFVGQTAYLFFFRLLFIRIYEDFKIIKRPVIDGGLISWHEFMNGFSINPAHSPSVSSYPYSDLISLVFGKGSISHSHFHKEQDIFYWFELNDSIFIELLAILDKYDFKDLSFDIIGKIYESYVDRFHRKEKGLFYTPPEIIDYILDEIGYIEDAKILTRTMIDPSCGSGAFLVHAAKRLINAHVNKTTKKIDHPEVLIQSITTQLIGLDINPFSCYLAEINLFLELVKALTIQGFIPQVTGFSIFQTNSLESNFMIAGATASQKNTTLNQFVSSTNYEALKTADKIKNRIRDEDWKFDTGFDYVVGNPPYGAKTIPENLAGEDSFILFIKLGQSLLSEGGRIGYIVPGVWLSNTGNRGIVDTMAPNRKKILHELKFINITNLFDVAFTNAYIDNIIFIAQKSEDPSKITDDKFIIRHLDKLTATLDDLKNKNWAYEIEISQNECFVSRDQYAIPFDHFVIDLVPDPLKRQIWSRIKPHQLIERAHGTLQIAPLSKKKEKEFVTLDSIADVTLGISPYQGWTRANQGYRPQEASDRKINFSRTRPSPDSWLQGETSDAHRWNYFWNPDNYYYIENYNILGTRPPDPNHCFRGQRIIIRRLINRQRRLQACLIEENDFVITKTAYTIMAKDGESSTLKYLLAILNSKLLSFVMLYLPFFDMRKIKDDSPTLEPNDLKALPVVIPTQDEKDAIVAKMDIVYNKYQQIVAFLKSGGKIVIPPAQPGQMVNEIYYKDPRYFTYLTYIRDINRIGKIRPPMVNPAWRNCLRDWITSGVITANGDTHANFTTNEIINGPPPFQLKLRNNFRIESDELNLLKFLSELIDFHVAPDWNSIEASVGVPSSQAAIDFVSTDIPRYRATMLTAIQDAWKEEDELDLLIKNLYTITDVEFRFIQGMMVKWLR